MGKRKSHHSQLLLKLAHSTALPIMARTKADEIKRRRRMEANDAEAPQGEEAKAEEAQAEASKAEEPKAEVAAAEEPKADDDSQTTLVLGEVAAEEPKAEEAKAEAPQAECKDN